MLARECIHNVSEHDFCQACIDMDVEVQDRGRAAIAVLERLGYRYCDIPACNCGSWHAPEPWVERPDREGDWLMKRLDWEHDRGHVTRITEVDIRQWTGPDPLIRYLPIPPPPPPEERSE